MSLTGPSRALASRCLFCQPLPIRSRIAANLSQRRYASNEDSSDGKKPNPFLDKFRNEHKEVTGERIRQEMHQQQQRPGDISRSSIFADDERIAQQQQQAAAAADAQTNDTTAAAAATTTDSGAKRAARDPTLMTRVLDPHPASRERFERRKVIQLVKKGGRVTQKQLQKRTERELLVRSHNMKTSVKKLGMLARQISGMKVDDAITQMRFSKKKVAIEVLEQLEAARDEAIVARGMGLDLTPTGETLSKADMKPVDIQLKSGKRHTVSNPTDIYIDQAWVGRGPYGKLPDFRARGRVFMMRTPWTSMTVVLKEEKTRLREYAEREEKRKRDVKTWVPLPDRPVQWQRQWYTF